MFKQLSTSTVPNHHNLIIDSESPIKGPSRYSNRNSFPPMIGHHVCATSEVTPQQTTYLKLCIEQADLINGWNSLVMNTYHIRKSAPLIHSTLIRNNEDVDRLLQQKIRLYDAYNEKLRLLIQHVTLLMEYQDKIGISITHLMIEAHFSKLTSEAQLTDEIRQLKVHNQRLTHYIKEFSLEGYDLLLATEPIPSIQGL